jgi:hypothetical protein
MMLCVMFNSAAPAAAAPLMAPRRGCAAQEEKRSPTRTTARNPNVRSFTITISTVARGKRLTTVRRESCRIIRDLGSGNQIDAAMIFAMAPATAELWLQIESAGEAAYRSGTNATATGSKQRNRGRQADKTKKNPR